MKMTVYQKTVEILICFSYAVFEDRRWEKMHIEIKIDRSCKETRMIVVTNAFNNMFSLHISDCLFHALDES